MKNTKLASLPLFLVSVFGTSLPLPAYSETGKLLHAAVAVDTQTRPATSFPDNVPQLSAFYIGDALKAGDKLRGVWIAEDVGTAAPKNTKIDEASLVVKSPTDNGAFSLSKPTAGWPIGDYRVEIYVGETLADTVKFKIGKSTTAATAEAAKKAEAPPAPAPAATAKPEAVANAGAAKDGASKKFQATKSDEGKVGKFKTTDDEEKEDDSGEE